MKIVCLVKFVPDVENFKYDYEKNVIIRENTKLILNPEDQIAVGLALEIKNKFKDVDIEIVTMGPRTVIPQLEDLLRRNIDNAILITDKKFIGSDSYATSKILFEFLVDKEFDLILTGTQSLDGDTAHVPSQIAELLNIVQVSNISKVKIENLNSDSIEVEVNLEKKILNYEIALPAIISMGMEGMYKLPFVKYKDLNLDVKNKILILNNEDLILKDEDIGFQGSKTKVNRTYFKNLNKKEKIVLPNNDEAIEVVYDFLRIKGFV